MGKKGKRQPSKTDESTQYRNRPFSRLSRPKRNRLNILVDNLLKLASGVPPKLWDHHVEIQDILKEIIEIEAEITPTDNVDRSTLINSFEKWLSENKAGFEGVCVAEFPGYDLGLKALKPFKEDSLVLTIPRKLMLTDEDAQQSILKGLTEKDPLLKHMLNVRLTLYLLTEKVKEDSFWKPYINILPSKYTTVLYFTVQEMEFLKGSPVFERTLFLYQSIARQYAYFYKLLHTSGLEVAKLLRETFTFDQYRWAVSTVMTRQNLVPSTANPDSNTLALIPLWDMCNHADGKITTDYNVNLQRGECYAFKDFSEGDQFFIFYGIRTNSNLFLHNGFVYPDNIHDSLLIPLGVSSGDPLKNEKLELIEKLGLPPQFHLDHGNGLVGAFILAFAKVFCMTKDELSAWNNNPDFMNLLLQSSANSYINPDLNRRAYSFLNMRFNLILSTYKTKPRIIEEIKDDIAKIEITESADQQNVHRNIVLQLKKSEAEILDQAIKFTKANMEFYTKKQE